MNNDRHWLTLERFRALSQIAAVLFATVFAVGALVLTLNGDLATKPVGDFIQYWAASHLALAGHASDAYSMQRLAAAMQSLFPQSSRPILWFYPPTFYLLIAPLALLHYTIAYAVFTAASLAAYLWAFRRVTPSTEALWCLVGFSGVWINAACGQNGFFTAALAAGALVLLRRRPAVAGVCIGLLAIKPHLALLFPVALIAIGAWDALATAAITVVAFTGASIAVLGTATLKSFLTNLHQATLLLHDGAFPLRKMPTVFSAMRMLGAPAMWAYVAHAAVALVAAASVWHVWRRCTDMRIRGAVLMTASLLVSPYLFDYDLTWLAFPIAWIALKAAEDGWLRGEREVLIAAWLLPVFVNAVASKTHVQIGPAVLCTMLWMTVRRVQCEVKAEAAETQSLTQLA